MADIIDIIRDLEQQRNAIETALAALRGPNTGAKATSNPRIGTPSNTPRKRQMSAAGRKRISEATRRRWAEKRAAESSAAAANKIATAKSTSKKTVAVNKAGARKEMAARSSSTLRKSASTKKKSATTPKKVVAQTLDATA